MQFHIKVTLIYHALSLVRLLVIARRFPWSKPNYVNGIKSYETHVGYYYIIENLDAVQVIIIALSHNM